MSAFMDERRFSERLVRVERRGHYDNLLPTPEGTPISDLTTNLDQDHEDIHLEVDIHLGC
jgi:hypothetical protein